MNWFMDKIKPKHKYLYRMLCRHCDLFWDRLDEKDNKCPGCGRAMVVFEVLEAKD